MTTTVTIAHHEDSASGSYQIVITDAALTRARFKFNPSQLDNVIRIKALVAALYTELDAMSADGELGNHPKPSLLMGDVRNALDDIQSGAMFAVSAATAHLA